MKLNEKLYEFLTEKSGHLAEEWAASLDENRSGGIYALEETKSLQKINEQYEDFYRRFNQLFTEERDLFYKDVEEWVVSVATDENHLRTPLPLILDRFFDTQRQYIDLIRQFSDLHEGEVAQKHVEKWYREVMDAIGEIVGWFTAEHYKFAQKTVNAQREMINELSSPVISLDNNRALLPLVGDIDTARANCLLENTLLQCSQKQIRCLFIDLSGVVIVDTMVAHQLFRLVEALRLLGVKSIISGIRPEIAQTAVQLGIDFKEIITVSTLEQAIRLVED